MWGTTMPVQHQELTHLFYTDSLPNIEDNQLFLFVGTILQLSHPKEKKKAQL